MDDEGFSMEDILKDSLDKALMESLIMSEIKKNIYNYIETASYVKECFIEFNTHGKLPDDYGNKILDALKSDIINNDSYLSDLKLNYPEYYDETLKSSLEAVDTASEILSKWYSSKNYELRFMLYYHGKEMEPLKVDENQVMRNIDRIKRIANSDNPEDAIPAIKDQFILFFEDVYKQKYSEISNTIGRYSGIGKDLSYIYTERLLSVYEWYNIDDEVRSDVRVIRNTLSHQHYKEEDGKMILNVTDELKIELTIQSFIRFMMTSLYKINLAELLVHLMTLEILRKIEL